MSKVIRPRSASSSHSSSGQVRRMALENLNNDEEDGELSLEEKPIRRPSVRSSGKSDDQRPPQRIESLDEKEKTALAESVGSEDPDEDEDVDDDEEDDEENGSPLEGVYNPADYEHLNVSAEIKELFQYITRFTPQAVELEHKLKPFIPDFIPAVGDIDAFIKVMRPDGKPDNLGLHVIDEPAAKQSDPTVLNLQLRALSKDTSSKAVTVKTLEDADKNNKEIENWIRSISDLHRSKPPPAVHYSRNMPSIDSLMQEWDPEFEDLLKEVNLPSADIDCNLSNYIEIVCGLLDVPIYKSKIQSLHVLFSLYLAFKKHQHFQNRGTKNGIEDEADAGAGDGVDRLVL